MAWKRSTRCSSGSCVEVAHEDGRILVRDSKRKKSPTIGFTPSGWRVFLEVAAAWDRESVVLASGVHISKLRGVVGHVCLLDSNAPGLTHLHYTWEEWDTFLEGVKAGEFTAEVLAGIEISDEMVEAYLRARNGPFYGKDIDRHIEVCRGFPIWEEARSDLAAAAPLLVAHATAQVTRFEVIDQSGRVLVRYDTAVELLHQDDGRTLKVVLRDRADGPGPHTAGTPDTVVGLHSACCGYSLPLHPLAPCPADLYQEGR